MPWKRSKYHALTQSNTHSGMRKNGGNSVRLQLAIKKKKTNPQHFYLAEKPLTWYTTTIFPLIAQKNLTKI